MDNNKAAASAAQNTQERWEAIGNLVRTTFGHGNPDARGLLVAECPGHTPESNRHARLIAAAPELLEAAEMLMAAASSHMTHRNAKERDAYAALRVAIAKATGSAA